MMLLLDIGNTRIKQALWDGALHVGEALVHDGRPVDCFLAAAWPRVEAVWLAAVPRMAADERWREAVLQHCGVAPQQVRAAAQWQGLRNAYSEPARLGVDRWLGMVALWQQQAGPFALVSAGTALTFDRVSASGQHLGGLIAPGFGAMQRSLLQVTQVAATAASEAVLSGGLGRDSESAIRLGALHAAAGMVSRALASDGADAAERRVLTGGDAAALLPHLGAGFVLAPELVLQGLLAVALAN